MKTKPLSIILFLMICFSLNAYSQRRTVGVHQLDSRFRFAVEKQWSSLGDYEEYYYYVHNNTSQEYKMVIEVTLTLNCVQTSPYKLGYNRVVYLKPNGTFSPSDDYVHNYMISHARVEECTIKEADTRTLYRGLSWTLSGIVNITEQKAAEAKKKQDEETAKQQKIADDKKKQDAEKKKQEDAKVEADKIKQNTNSNSGETTNSTSSTKSSPQGGGSSNTAQNNTNSTPQTSTTPSTVMPANTSGNDPLAHFETDSKTYSNPMNNNSNSGSNAIDNFNNGYQQGQQIADIATGLVDLFSASPEEKARQAREENLRIEKEAAAARARAHKIQMIASRKTLIKKYPDGKTPLSYEAKDASEVYFFTYSYQPAAIESNSPDIYISNVFPVSKYSDGTWQYKSSLMSDIAKNNAGLDLILSGYYMNKEEAVRQQQFLMNEARAYNFTVKNISYAGKKSTGSTSDQTDFWGTPAKEAAPKPNTETPKKQAPANDDDFWGTPTEQKPKTETQKKTAPAKSNEVDFWGNPIK